MRLGAYTSYGDKGMKASFVGCSGMNPWVSLLSLFWIRLHVLYRQIQVLVTGGEDSKLNAWKINTITLDDDEVDSDTEFTERDQSETMTTVPEVEMASPKSRKRDRKGGVEKVGFFPHTT